ncbi:hypothetical protein DRO33_02075 [Candidatus Bathyarchaeota archaeon]|nr:MAG: hypothetical protein DRO33_02075 [Candidatus Bathyarchaeota archaeon]
MRAADKLYYARAIIGFAAGLGSALLSGLRLSPFFLTWVLGMAWAAAFYVATYRALRPYFKRELKKRDIALLGLEAYILTWLMSWTLFYTVLGFWA